MSYVKWNSSKFHVVNMFGPGGTRTGDGRVTAVPVGDAQEGGPAYTKCGRAIPTNNQYLGQLPAGLDIQNDVCSACSVGIGIAKTPGPEDQQARDNSKLKNESEKLKERIAASARDLFT